MRAACWGQKVITVLPELVQERNQLAMMRLQKNIGELQKMIGAQKPYLENLETTSLRQGGTVQRFIFRFGKIDHGSLTQNSPMNDRSPLHFCHGEISLKLIDMFA